MKTVVENNEEPDKRYPLPERESVPGPGLPARRKSCFYDFGAYSPVEFSGFSEDGNSAFIDKVAGYLLGD